MLPTSKSQFNVAQWKLGNVQARNDNSSSTATNSAGYRDRQDPSSPTRLLLLLGRVPVCSSEKSIASQHLRIHYCLIFHCACFQPQWLQVWILLRGLLPLCGICCRFQAANLSWTSLLLCRCHFCQSIPGPVNSLVGKAGIEKRVTCDEQ